MGRNIGGPDQTWGDLPESESHQWFSDRYKSQLGIKDFLTLMPAFHSED